MYAGGYHDPYYLNVEDVTVQDVTALNVAASASNTTTPAASPSCSRRPARPTTPTTASSPRCRVEGGNIGMAIQGNGSGAMQMDRIYIRDCGTTR